MGVKSYLLLAALCAWFCPGCETAKRLAPPGFIKYEDIAGDEPVNPAIKARIDERRREGDGAFPVLSEQNREKPGPPDRAGLAEFRAELTAAGESLALAADTDRARAEATETEAAAALEEQRRELEADIADQRRKAAAERASRPR